MNDNSNLTLTDGSSINGNTTINAISPVFAVVAWFVVGSRLQGLAVAGARCERKTSR